MWWLYQAAFALLLLVAGPFLLVARGRHYGATLSGRLTRRLPRPAPGGIWIHAVSVGEVAVAGTLVGALPEPLALTVTTVTPTGQERARRLLGGRAAVGYLPIDLGFAVGRFLDRVRPRALVLVEGDYWPLVLREVARRRIPVAVVNGRISDRGFARLRFVRRLAERTLLGRVERFGVQTELDGERLRALGVAPERIVVTGNLKFEAAEPAELPELAVWLVERAAGRPLLLAGSTMPGEEELLLDAFAAAGGPAQSLLVLAPRHPERFEAVAAEMVHRLPALARRSRREAPAQTDAVLLDTLGELPAAYRQAQAAFIGGTLVDRGGHNPLEAARFAVPIAVGPSMRNFREIAESFDRSAAWRRVRDGAELGRLWREWLEDPAAARAHGERGRALVEANRGALARTLQLLAPFLAAAGEERP
jgi:3-deoxy-D-manno-octulosonic-acid transferase